MTYLRPQTTQRTKAQLHRVCIVGHTSLLVCSKRLRTERFVEFAYPCGKIRGESSINFEYVNHIVCTWLRTIRPRRVKLCTTLRYKTRASICHINQIATTQFAQALNMQKIYTTSCGNPQPKRKTCRLWFMNVFWWEPPADPVRPVLITRHDADG